MCKGGGVGRVPYAFGERRKAKAKAKAKHKGQKKRHMEGRVTSCALIANAHAILKTLAGISTQT